MNAIFFIIIRGILYLKAGGKGSSENQICKKTITANYANPLINSKILCDVSIHSTITF